MAQIAEPGRASSLFIRAVSSVLKALCDNSHEMRRTASAIACLFVLTWTAVPQTPLTGASKPPTTPAKPRLVLAIVIDQFRYDYLERFRDGYKGGIDTLLRRGAVFTNAYYEHFPTVTAVGHSTLLSGATPAISGIIDNSWFDRASGKNVTSVSDESVKAVGGPGPGASPHRLLTSTLCDQLKMSQAVVKTKCIGISLKDRSAILTNGHMADAAYWFDDGLWLTSTYYMDALPGWAADYNASKAPERFKGQAWRALGSAPDSNPFVQLPNEIGDRYWTALETTPSGNELILDFAQRALDAEHLGQRPGETDILAVSFSANDLYGHSVGPDDPGVRDLAIRTDEQIGRLLRAVDQKVGLANTVVLLSADHGVPPTAEAQQARHMPGGRIAPNSISKAIEDELTARYGSSPGKWVSSAGGGLFPYLDQKRISDKKLDLAEVRTVAADAVRKVAHVARVYTPEQLRGMSGGDFIDQRVRNGFNAERGSDLYVVFEPYYYGGTGSGTTHQSPYNYDAHVPLIFLSPLVQPGRYDGKVMVNDAAPTLAVMLRVEPPAGSAGRVLTEMLVRPRP